MRLQVVEDALRMFAAWTATSSISGLVLFLEPRDALEHLQNGAVERSSCPFSLSRLLARAFTLAMRAGRCRYPSRDEL